MKLLLVFSFELGRFARERRRHTIVVCLLARIFLCSFLKPFAVNEQIYLYVVYL